MSSLLVSRSLACIVACLWSSCNQLQQLAPSASAAAVRSSGAASQPDGRRLDSGRRRRSTAGCTRGLKINDSHLHRALWRHRWQCRLVRVGDGQGEGRGTERTDTRAGGSQWSTPTVTAPPHSHDEGSAHALTRSAMKHARALDSSDRLAGASATTQAKKKSSANGRRARRRRFFKSFEPTAALEGLTR